VSEPRDVTRREALKLAGGALAAANMPALRAAAAAPALRFFTRDEFALADTLCELIVPSDAHSTGARAAGAALYIDGRLAEAFTDEPRSLWREGLRRMNELAEREHRRPFLQLAAGQQVALLERLAAAEAKPSTDDERFFAELKRRTVDAYYTSRVGIHDELEYKGNVLLQEFAGIDVSQDG
jgi:hypothetical protein